MRQGHSVTNTLSPAAPYAHLTEDASASDADRGLS